MKKLFTLFILLIGGVVLANAASYSLYVAGTQVTDANKNNIMSGVVYDSDSKTLTLTNANISSGSRNGIESYIEDLTIKIVGYCKVRSEQASGIRLHDNTTIRGNDFDDLFVNSSEDTGSLGIFVSGGSSLTIEYLWLRVYGGNYALTGDNGKDKLTVRQSYVMAKTNNEGRSCITDFESISLGGSTYDYDGHKYDKTNHVLLDANGKNAALHFIRGRLTIGKRIIDPRSDYTLTSSSKSSGITSGTVKWSSSDKRLTMDGVTMTAPVSYNAISFYGFYDSSDGLNVWVMGTNTINTTSGGDGFYTYKRDLTLDGQNRNNAVLNINSGASKGIYASGSLLYIRTLDLEISSKDHAIQGIGNTELLIGDGSGGSKITATSSDKYAFYGFSSCEFFGNKSMVNTAVSAVRFNESKKGFTYLNGSLAEKVAIDVPTTNYNIDVCGITLNNLNASNVIVDGLQQGTISWNNSNSTLYLTDVILESTNPNQAVVRPREAATVTISGTNHLSGGHSTFYPTTDLTFNGTGDLYCDATTGTYGEAALRVGGNAGTITINVAGKVQFKGFHSGYSKLYSTSPANKLVLKKAAFYSDYTFEGDEDALCNVYGGLELDGMSFYSNPYHGGNPGCYFDEEQHAVRQNGNQMPKLVNFYPPTDYYDLYVGNTQVNDCNCYGVGSKYIIGGGPEAVSLSGYELQLNGVTIDTDGKYNAIWNKGFGDLIINVNEPSTINSKNNFSSIRMDKNTTIMGSELTLTGYYGDLSGRGNAQVYIDDIKIHAEGELWGNSDDSPTLMIRLKTPGTRVYVKNGVHDWNHIYLVDGTRIEKPIGAKLSSDYTSVVTSDGSKAYEVIFADPTPTDIDEVTVNTDSEVIGIFDTQGHQLEKMQPGVNIVHKSDGSTQKVVKK